MGWLVEISADVLQEVVAHLRHVCDDALDKSTVTLLYFYFTWKLAEKHIEKQSGKGHVKGLQKCKC